MTLNGVKNIMKYFCSNNIFRIAFNKLIKHRVQITFIMFLLWIPTQLLFILITLIMKNNGIVKGTYLYNIVQSLFYEFRTIINGFITMALTIILINDSDRINIKHSLIYSFKRLYDWFIGSLYLWFKTVLYGLCVFIPGIYKYTQLSLFEFIVIDKNSEGYDACIESSKITKSHWWYTFGALTFGLILNLFMEYILLILEKDASILLLIILLPISKVICSYGIIIRYCAYQRLKNLTTAST